MTLLSVIYGLHAKRQTKMKGKPEAKAILAAGSTGSV